jgi:excisionase family DNA binding protein
MNDQRLLTVREVAERLRSSPETVRRWLRQGKLRGFRPGGTKLGYRVPEGELQRFIHLSQTAQGDSLTKDAGKAD